MMVTVPFLPTHTVLPSLEDSVEGFLGSDNCTGICTVSQKWFGKNEGPVPPRRNVQFSVGGGGMMEERRPGEIGEMAMF